MNEAWGTGTLLAEVGAEVLSYTLSGGDTFYYVTCRGNESGDTNLIANWDFESGDLADWTVTSAEGAEVSITGLNGPASTGEYSAYLNNDFLAFGLVLKQSTPIGSASAGNVDWSFDMLLDQADVGGVFFAEVFAEQYGTGILGGSGLQGPFWPWANWQTFSGSFEAPAGTDFLTIQFTATTGAATGSNCRAHIDNVFVSQGTVVVTPDDVPTIAAPTPTVSADSVIALFSNAYSCVTVDTWSANWDDADLCDTLIAGNDTKLYRDLVYAGVEFTSQPVDASEMSHFHMDLWTPEETSAAQFGIKLVDFGADGAYDGGDDAEHTVWITGASATPLQSGSWVSVDVSLDDFSSLAARAHLAQLVLEGLSTVYIDNVYFRGGDGGSGPVPESPQQAAPVPTLDPTNVLALYSDSYPQHPVDTWSAGWDSADLAEETLSGNSLLHYSNMAYAGVEFTSEPIDAYGYSHLHFDLWTAQSTALPRSFTVRLVDFGSTGVYGGGDDSESDVAVNATSTPPLAAGHWLSYDLPLTDFSALNDDAHLAQLLWLGDLSEFWVDNVYFYNDGSFTPSTEPQEAAATPLLPETEVVSLYCSVYADEPIAAWSAAGESVQIQQIALEGDATLLFTELEQASISLEYATDLALMSHLHLDLWTPEDVALPANFCIELIDWGANAAPGGGDDSSQELCLTAATSPALRQGRWLSLNLPLSSFANIGSLEHFGGLRLSGDLPTIYLDNLYFYTICYPTSRTDLIYFR